MNYKFINCINHKINNPVPRVETEDHDHIDRHESLGIIRGTII